MLGNAAPTPFDLRFSLLGIPVRVHPFFWVFTAAGGWNPHDLTYMFLWVACVFVSILVHEFGHALMARFCEASTDEVVLYCFGGYAAVVPGRRYTTTRSVLISLAGPGAGFVLFGVVWCLELLVTQKDLFPDNPDHRQYLGEVFFVMKYINFWWGMVNLLPVYPLDGGRVSRDLFVEFRPRDGLEVSLKLSLLVAAGVAVYLFSEGRPFGGMLFGSLAFENLQYLQGARYR